MIKEEEPRFINIYYEDGDFLKLKKIEVQGDPFTRSINGRISFDNNLGAQWFPTSSFALSSFSVIKDLIEQMTDEELEDKLACILERVWRGGFSCCDSFTQEEKMRVLFLLKKRLQNHTCFPWQTKVESFSDRTILRALASALYVCKNIKLYLFFFSRLANVRKQKESNAICYFDEKGTIENYDSCNPKHWKRLESLLKFHRKGLFTPHIIAFDRKNNSCITIKNQASITEIYKQKLEKLRSDLLEGLASGYFLIKKNVCNNKCSRFGCIIYKKQADDATIKMVMVTCSQRRKGIATDLLNRTILDLKKQGVKNISCKCPLVNYGALKFFFQNKFVPKSFCQGKSRLTLAYTGNSEE